MYISALETLLLESYPRKYDVLYLSEVKEAGNFPRLSQGKPWQSRGKFCDDSVIESLGVKLHIDNKTLA